MKKTIFVCALALLTGACVCDNGRESIQQRYYEQPAYMTQQPQQATVTYRSYVQASYTQPVRQQVVYQQPVQRPVYQQPVYQRRVYPQQVVQQPVCTCRICGC
jgi:hypothetical protein